nr:MAG TPA: hypothetical protein [Caudoviricetes sp.]
MDSQSSGQFHARSRIPINEESYWVQSSFVLKCDEWSYCLPNSLDKSFDS